MIGSFRYSYLFSFILLFLIGNFFLPTILISQEICDNAIDDDNDGLIDFQDDECECEFIEIRSLIPNPSFEEMSCCPDQHYRLDCTSAWIQAYGVTPDYIHTCGWSGPDDIKPATPFPDGDGVIGFLNGRVPQNLPIEYDWKEYAGTCLLAPMRAGVSYTIEYSLGFSSQLRSPPLELTLYGSDDCDNFPFGIDVVLPGCPTNFPDWVRLEGQELEGVTFPSWIKGSFEFTPDRDIRTIAIGPPCEPFDGEISNYYFLDNLIMEETFKFQFKVRVDGDPCSNDKVLTVDSDEDLEYQWYKDLIALPGETGVSVDVRYGEGSYRVRLINPDGCIMSDPFQYTELVPPESEVEVTICEGETYRDGDFTATEEGLYQYIVPSSSGCDSTINLTLSFCKLYVPNAFSPNDDGHNDLFRVYGGNDDAEYTLLIFDRWGGKVFEGKEWDGTINGSPAPVGVYIYLIRVDGNTLSTLSQQGNITLIR